MTWVTRVTCGRCGGPMIRDPFGWICHRCGASR